MKNHLNRRDFAKAAGVMLGGITFPGTLWSQDLKPGRMTLGYSSYALPGKTPQEAIRLIAAAGYDSIELCIFPMETLPQGESLQEIQHLLQETGLKLPSLMENLKPLGSAEEYQQSTERLKQACDFARKFERQPLIQTVLGGKDWESSKDRCRDRLAAWQEIAADAEIVLAIKPHRGHAMSRPENARWLIQSLGDSSYLRICYDYSHFIYRDMSMPETLAECLPMLAHVAVKDAEQINGKIEFKAPGDVGTIDYAALIRQLAHAGYQGDVCVEVSSQVWRQPGYRFDKTMSDSYRVLAAAFEKAGVHRS